MESRQVNIHMKGKYYFCPHCESHMKIDYQSEHCPDCGKELNWNDVNIYRDICSISYPYEDVGDFCTYYKDLCCGSKTCHCVKEMNWLNDHIGYLTAFEKRQVLFDKGWLL